MKKKIRLRADKVSMSYRHEGSGRYNIILLHGWCINNDFWEEQISFLSSSYNVYAPDLPGFGDSKAERDNWTMEEFALDVLDFIRTLELKNIILIGHSMSGGIMADVVIKSSGEIIGMIGVDNFKSVGSKLTDDENYQIERFIERLHKDYKNTVKAYSETFLFVPSTSEKVRERVKDEFAETDPAISISSFRNLMAFSDKLGELLEMLPLKLFLINSDATPTDEKSLEEKSKNGYEVLYIHDTGHYPMIEKPQDFNRLLNDAVCTIVSSVENDLTVRVTESIEAPVANVWKALTDPEKIREYMFGVNVESEWKEGAEIKWTGYWNGKMYEDKGTITEYRPPLVLSFTHYSNLSDLPDKAENYHFVSYQLAPGVGQTSLLITQDNNRTEKERDHSRKNWKEMAARLKKLVENEL